MSIEHNKKLVMRFLNEFMIGQDIKVLDELLGPSYRQHNPGLGHGKAALIKFFKDFWAIHPKPGYHLKRILAENDLVAIHYHFQPELDEPGYAIVDIFRVENDLLVEHWDVCQDMPDSSGNDSPMF
jgi:predicted SnoaL-like aldol condensation-catalyzing enzyme